jgi:precorrin-6B methylase 1
MTAKRGSLTVIGIGIRAPAQATLEASAAIARAERVFSIVADPVAEYWIRSLNSNTEPLTRLYAVGKPRLQTYREMVERIVESVRAGFQVCAVSYGHPGVYAYPLHESIRRLRAEGFKAEMLPGISADACLFAELGIDPADAGCRSYEATDFLVLSRSPDTASGLLLWQIGSIAEAGVREMDEAWNLHGLSVLTERLLQAYRPEHEVIVYEASRYPLCDSTVVRTPLVDLPQARVTALSTLYVPPMTKARPDATMARRLGII